MKKKILILLVVVLSLFVNVQASSKDDLKEKLFQKMKVGDNYYSLDSKQKEQAIDYIDNEITSESELNIVKEKIEQAIKIIQNEGNIDFKNYSSSSKNALKKVVMDITSQTSLKATLNKDALIIYKGNGEEIRINHLVKQTGYGESVESIIILLSSFVFEMGLIYFLIRKYIHVKSNKKCLN